MFLRSIIILIAYAAYGNANCPGQFEPVGDYCYVFENTTRISFLEAQQYCEGLSSAQGIAAPTGLAMPKECDQREAVSLHALTVPIQDGYSYWLGGSDANTEGRWYWLDTERTPMEMGVPYWATLEDGTLEPSGGEDQNCLTLYQPDGYQMHDAKCSKNGYALCEIN